jgi:acetyltransferase EpsM
VTTNNYLVIWGASGHALVVADILRLCGDHQIVGFIDDVNLDRQGREFCGATILGGQEQLDKLSQKGIKKIIFAFGNGEARLRLSRLARQKGFDLVTAIHPRAIIANDAIIGSGSVIVGGAVINPGVKLGENVIVNTSASVDHECIVEDGVHICPGVHLGAGVSLGRASWIGIGATIKDRVTIGAGALIGAGSVVLNDIQENAVAYGVPARVVRSGGQDVEDDHCLVYKKLERQD